MIYCEPAFSHYKKEVKNGKCNTMNKRARLLAVVDNVTTNSTSVFPFGYLVRYLIVVAI